MAGQPETSEVNIHLRARSGDRDLIDRAANISGTNRSQFMLSSALKEATNVLLDQTMIRLDAEAFQKVLTWMDAVPSEAESKGIDRLKSVKSDWANG
ncbi:DUF1778 domain-containing protein [Rhizobium sp. TH2]|uniref:type II toxin-antitoxin system TacA family antitoxin n=1 Tax=Rhizobium sp. TH2 TaxID=2775403 RepID=UPI00215717C7|nr:DUF1778 domain-containing protein [Rhizobium sp. TH2]UVC07626.1 DUF1778 domain-containing protein [Rhizobium sp. TH2]